MSQVTMPNGKVGSPSTTLTVGCDSDDTDISFDTSILPSDVPNLCTLGTASAFETVWYTSKDASAIHGCTRGYDGTSAAAWNSGTPVARYISNYDLSSRKDNINDLDTRLDTIEAKALIEVTTLTGAVQGDLVMRGASAFALFHPGATANLFLRTNTNGSDLTWSNPQIDLLAAPTDTNSTNLNASTSAHGLLKKLDNDANHFMNGQGNWVGITAGQHTHTEYLESTATAADSDMLDGMHSDEFASVDLSNVDIPGAVNGSILIFNGTSWTHLAPVANRTLRTDGSGIPSWST